MEGRFQGNAWEGVCLNVNRELVSMHRWKMLD